MGGVPFVGGAAGALRSGRKGRTAQGTLDYLTATAPTDTPTPFDEAVRAAASTRMRIGMGRASTFLTGLPFGGGGGRAGRSVDTSGLRDRMREARAIRVGARSSRTPSGGGYP